MKIHYRVNAEITVQQVIEVFESSGIKRPTKEVKRIQRMIEEAGLIVTAWDGLDLVGIARSLTDYSYCTYLSDLAVKKEYQRKGIGKQMIEITRSEMGEECILLLLAAPGAMNYYKKEFLRVENGFIIKRAH